MIAVFETEMVTLYNHVYLLSLLCRMQLRGFPWGEIPSQVSSRDL